MEASSSDDPERRRPLLEAVAEWGFGAASILTLFFVVHGLWFAGRTLVSSAKPVAWSSLARPGDLPHRVQVTGFVVAPPGEAAAPIHAALRRHDRSDWHRLVDPAADPRADVPEVWVKVADDQAVPDPLRAYVEVLDLKARDQAVLLRPATPTWRFLMGVAEVGIGLFILVMARLLYLWIKPESPAETVEEPRT